MQKPVSSQSEHSLKAGCSGHGTVATAKRALGAHQAALDQLQTRRVDALKAAAMDQVCVLRSRPLLQLPVQSAAVSRHPLAQGTHSRQRTQRATLHTQAQAAETASLHTCMRTLRARAF